MAVQHGLHVLAAAAVAAGVLTGRWWYTRARRNSGHGASAARAPWRRTPAMAGAGAGHERVVGLHAAFLDLAGNQALKTADAHLDRYWATVAPLYPHSDPGRTPS
ncbi:hypothetical protein OG444_05115 [Streptomyces sp. NBC_01232]|uniref:hypothetical protein n=1 Tax=Streptomyces sp. NBC_01232 TaxID=2903786 RepID=UPI002E1121F9|nr:hypothetical protein OG444_05115 [Streptomyces sp. NBC_01232]